MSGYYKVSRIGISICERSGVIGCRIGLAQKPIIADEAVGDRNQRAVTLWAGFQAQ